MSAVKDGYPADRGLVPARGKIGPPPIIVHDRWWKRLGLTGAPVDDEEVARFARAQHDRASQARGPICRGSLTGIQVHPLSLDPQNRNRPVLGSHLVGPSEEGSVDVTVRSKRDDMHVEVTVTMVRRPCPHATCIACRAGRQDFCYTGDFTERGINGAHGFMTEFRRG